MFSMKNKDFMHIADKTIKLGEEIINVDIVTEQSLDEYFNFFRQLIQTAEKLGDMNDKTKATAKKAVDVNNLVTERLTNEKQRIKEAIMKHNSKLNVDKKYYNWLKKPNKLDKKT